ARQARPETAWWKAAWTPSGAAAGAGQRGSPTCQAKPRDFNRSRGGPATRGANERRNAAERSPAGERRDDHQRRARGYRRAEIARELLTDEQLDVRTNLALLVDHAKPHARVRDVQRGEHAADGRRKLGREDRNGDRHFRGAGVRAQR